MTSNNSRQVYQSEQDQPVSLISAIGFGPAQEEKLKALFQLARHGKPVYQWVLPSEQGIAILLLNYDNPESLPNQDSLPKNIHIVGFSHGPLSHPPEHHFRGMLTGARLMALLDKLPTTVATVAELKPTNVAHPGKLELVQTPAKTPETVAAELPQSAAPVKYRALVVDDSVAIQKSLELKLATLEQIDGIDFAENGVDALAMAQATHYHLIFLDVMMPGMDGYETCTQLRRIPDYKKTPIIMVSGKTSPLDEVKGIMAGCTTYLTKPVQDEAFQKLSLRVLAWLTARNTEGH
ncbi:MAG: response regulator [Methylococcales bacterium]|nr:response regulator [Methylococcales bacterium]